MALKIFLLALFVSAFTKEIPDFEIVNEFAKFIKEHGREYPTVEETMKRYAIFAATYKRIEEFNEKGKKARLAINHFADLTDEEFRSTYLTRHTESPCKLEHIKITPVPLIDWRLLGAVTPVKKQGKCGAGWAFSAIGAIEGRGAIKKGELIEYSEQELIDCSTKQGNQGCNKGAVSQAFDYVKDEGLTTANYYPYRARVEACQSHRTPRSIKIKGCADVPPDDSDALLEALATGPVSVLVNADNDEFKYYDYGIITEDCGEESDELDHSITLVGTGYEAEWRITYWIAKNSWGTSWGEIGYVNIVKKPGKGHTECRIASKPSYPIL